MARHSSSVRFKRKRLGEYYGFQCLKCGTTPEHLKDLAVNHVLPESKGGNHNMFNLQLLCVPCATEKDDQVIDYRHDKGEYFRDVMYERPTNECQPPGEE